LSQVLIALLELASLADTNHLMFNRHKKIYELNPVRVNVIANNEKIRNII